MADPVSRKPIQTLREAQMAIDAFVASRGWYGPASRKPQRPRNLAASISLEANEVLECFQWSEETDSAAVADELADVVLYTAQLANVLGIDLGEALSRKMADNYDRFPPGEEEPWAKVAS